MTVKSFDVRSFWPPAERKKNLACVTMVRNEEFFLEMMLHHYLRLEPETDFYIIDHASDIPVLDFISSTFNLPSGQVNIIRIPDIPFDDDFKSTALSNLASMVTMAYEVVIVSDADELVVSEEDNLVQACLAHSCDIVAPLGFEVIQHIQREESYNFSLPVFVQRSYGYFKSSETKPIIWKAPSMLSAGLHKTLHPFEVSDTLLTLHMRFSDVIEATKRFEERQNSVLSQNQKAKNYGSYWTAALDVRLGIFNKLKTVELKDFSKTRSHFLGQVRRSLHVNAAGFHQPDLHIVSDLCVR